MPLCAAADPGHPVGKQHKAREGDDCTADAEQEQPPAVDTVALGPVHDVETPDEIEQAPGIAARRPEGTAGSIDVDARRSLVSIGDLPGWKGSAELGPDRLIDNPRGRDRRSWSGPGAQGNGFGRFSRNGREFLSRRGIVKANSPVDLSDFGDRLAVERTRSHRSKGTPVFDPGRERCVDGQRLRGTRNDVFGANLFQVEKRHEGTGAHPQENLETDENRQPLMDLAAQHMQAQLQ